MNKFPLDLSERVVLIVDDNPTNLRVIVGYLEEYGFEIITALDGEEVFEKLHYVQPDLILLDVMMPGIDGFEVCRRLKADEGTQHIPVIFMTALAGAEDKVRGFEVGGVDYITKPIEQSEVLARVVVHLQIQAQGQQLRAQAAELAKAKQISDSLRAVANVLNATLDRDIVLDKIMEQFSKIVQANGVGILLPDGADLVLARTRNYADSYLGQRIPLASSHVGVQVFHSQQPLYIPNVRADARWQLWDEMDLIRSWVGVPLLNDAETIGVLMVDNFEVAAYNEGDVQLLETFANQAALAITNARLYELVQRTNQELAKLNVDKDRFFSILAHDLKGPFLPLLGNLELMTEMAANLSPQDVYEMSAAAHRSAKNVFNLLGDLLTWARLQMGRLEYNPYSFNLGQLVQQTINVLQEVAEAKGINLLNQVEPEVMVYADRYMVDTVIRNVTNNALKFTSKGGQVIIRNEELGIRNEESLIPNSQFLIPHYVTVSIADTGVGMPIEVKQRLFKIDQHVTTIGTGKEIGTGLGLIICQEMVMKWGGKIWVESELDKGTTVKFTV